MWLYTLDEFSCTRNAVLNADFENAEHRLVSWFYRGSLLAGGLGLLKEYTDRFNSRPTTGKKRFVIEYRLIAISQLPDDTDAAALESMECREISRERLEHYLSQL